MSQINNRIVTTFTSSAGNAIAVMNQMTGGMTNLGRAAYQSGAMSERANAQWRAFGTTIRYAIAGGVVFGATRLLTVLRDTQRQYALIGAISGGVYSSQTSGAQAADNALTSLYSNAQKGALEAITPVHDFNEALVNLFSTIELQGADKGKVAVELTTAISQGAQLATVPVDDLTRSITGMNQAFGRTQNLRNIQQGIRGFTELIYKAPGGPAYGTQFIQQLAPLAAVSRLAAITPQEMYGLYLTESRIGATPATGGRGLQYLLQSIAVPTSKGHAAALRQAGITPELVQEKGGLWAIRQLIKKTRSLGISGNLKKAANTPDDTLDVLDTADPSQQARGLGVSGQGIEFLSKAIGRIHGVRALIALMAQEQHNKQMTQDQETIANAMSNTEKAQKQFADTWADFARRQPLQAAAVSVDVIRRNIAQSLEPIVNFAGRGISKAGFQVQQHPKEFHRGVLGAVGVAALLGISGKVGLGSLLRGGSRLTGAGIAAEAALTQGGAGAGMSPQHPLFVMVVNDIFGTTGRGPLGRGPGPLGGPGGVPPVAASPSRLSRLLRFGVPVTPYVAAGALATTAYNRRHPLPKNPSTWDDFNQGFMGIPNAVRGAGSKDISIFKQMFGMGGDEELPRQRRINQLLANTWWGAVSGSRGAGGMSVIKGEANLTLDINLKHPDGTTQRKKVHVPVDLWSGGKVPSSRGKHGATHRAGPN